MPGGRSAIQFSVAPAGTCNRNLLHYWLACYAAAGDGEFERLELMPGLIGGDPGWCWHPQLSGWGARAVSFLANQK